jgi:hypothetical protein
MMNNMLQNLHHLFKNKKIQVIYILLLASAFWIWWYFTDVAIMFGNYGKIHTSIDIGLSMIMIIGFPLFLVALYHKGMLFGKKETLEKRNILGTLGGTLGTILSGCSCCGLTLASYFGLLPLMNLLPYDGLEIKIIGTLGLLYALSDIIRNLETCKVKSK